MVNRLDAEWERHRPAVFGVAYRLLGTVGDAEDVVQEVWLRASAADVSRVADLRAWLVTIGARTSYNILTSARARRERYVGPWLPEPLPTGADAATRVLVDESISTAMLVVMAELSPPERVAFVLHDVFEIPYSEIAGVLDRSPAAARKLGSRARRRLAAAKKDPAATRAERERVLTAFRAAVDEGALALLVGLLDPEAVYVADGGGKALAARRIVRGADAIARLAVWVHRRVRPDRVEFIEVGGEPALATYQDGTLLFVDTVEIAEGRIAALYRVVNPDKLAHLRHT